MNLDVKNTGGGNISINSMLCINEGTAFLYDYSEAQIKASDDSIINLFKEGGVEITLSVPTPPYTDKSVQQIIDDINDIHSLEVYDENFPIEAADALASSLSKLSTRYIGLKISQVGFEQNLQNSIENEMAIH